MAWCKPRRCNVDSKPIQTQPQGLLSFLQVKNQGQNPDTLLDTVQSTIDWDRWTRNVEAFNYALASYVGPTALGLAPFNIAPVSVPSREWWWVRTASLAITAPAASTIYAALACREGGGGLTRVRLLTNLIQCPGPAQNFIQSTDFWLAPGTQLLIAIGFEAGVTTTADAWINYTRLPI